MKCLSVCPIIDDMSSKWGKDMSIKLRELVHALEQSDELQSYVDIENGRVVTVGEGFSENPAGRDETEEERLSQVFSVEDDWQRYLVLPDIYEELRGFMKALAETCGDPEARECLLAALGGSGAVSRFNHLLRRLTLANQWSEYRRERLGELARDWCDENSIDYEE